MEIKSKFDKGDVVVAFCGAEEKLHSYLIKDIVGYNPETNEFKYECLRINDTVKVFSRETKYNDLINTKDPRISLCFYDHELYSDPFDYIKAIRWIVKRRMDWVYVRTVLRFRSLN